MYGLIGKITAVSGQRDALIDVLLGGVAGMPGCLSYVVAKDPTDPDTLCYSDHDHRLVLVVDDLEKGRSVSEAWMKEPFQPSSP